MTINILGTKYELTTAKDFEELDSDEDGFCDFVDKRIGVREDAELKNKEIRHEIIHAFMFESGLDMNSEFGRNEELIDWIAIQGEKIIKAWEEANALKENTDENIQRN